MAETETSPTTMVFGWIILLILGAMVNILPILVGIFLLYCGYLIVSGYRREPTPETITETPTLDIPTFTFDNADPVQATPPVSQKDIDDVISALYNLGYKNKGELKITVNSVVEQGAVSLEEIIRDSLQLLNSR